MMNTAIRIAIVVVLALVVHLGYLFVRSRGMPTAYRPLQRDPNGMPIRFEDPDSLARWEGKKVAMDPEISGAVDADIVVERLYKDILGHPISLHANVVSHYEHYLQHHPAHCYTTHGFRQVDEKRVELELDDTEHTEVELLTMDSEGNRVLVLYWYQIGDQIVFNGSELRTARYGLRGQKTWPNLIKVLMQTPAPDVDRAEKRLLDFAKLVYAWTKDLDRPPDADSSADSSANSSADRYAG